MNKAAQGELRTMGLVIETQILIAKRILLSVSNTNERDGMRELIGMLTMIHDGLSES